MSLFNLQARISLNTRDYEKGIHNAMGSAKDLAGKLGTGLANAAKRGTVAAGAGFAAMGTYALKSYADYEQLVGGVDTLFADSSDQLQEYAANAYATAGMSANQYMEQATSFSASLIQSLGGDTKKAADYADMAMTDMSDNANKMGTDMELIQNAYNGFAKSNFTMLDNLKLGYGGTKEEMQRLLEDAEKISGIEYDISSFADISEAIHVVQEEMGIAGTTAAEAKDTISGSVGMVKASWTNLATGMADDNADMELLVDQFAESVGYAADNIVPRIGVALDGTAELIDTTVPVIVDKVPQIVVEATPKLLKSGAGIIKSVVKGIDKNQDEIMEAADETLDTLLDNIEEDLPDIVVTGTKILGKLGIGMIKAIPKLVMSVPEIVGAVVEGFIDEGPEFREIGKDIVTGVWNGLMSMGDWLADNVRGFFGNVVGWAKDVLGIHSPSRVFKDQIGLNMALGVGEGFDTGFAPVKKSIDDALTFEPKTMQFNVETMQQYGGGQYQATRTDQLLLQILEALGSMGVRLSTGELVGAVDKHMGQNNIERERGIA